MGDEDGVGLGPVVRGAELAGLETGLVGEGVGEDRHDGDATGLKCEGVVDFARRTRSSVREAQDDVGDAGADDVIKQFRGSPAGESGLPEPDHRGLGLQKRREAVQEFLRSAFGDI